MNILNGLSFDIEDWFQVENLKGAISAKDWSQCDLRVVENTRKILRLLDSYNTKATFFILGWIAERCPSLIREIAGKGHEIASHGYRHELVYKMTPGEFLEDIRRSKEILEAISGETVYGYRAPSFSLTPETGWALDILKGLNFTYDSSVFPTSFHDRYGFTGSSRLPFVFPNGLVEIPLSTIRLCRLNFPIAGGGYFRLLPYFIFRGACRYLNMRRETLFFYLHPWELDPGQPKVKIQYVYKFRHYINLKKTEKRLGKMLKEFRFAPFSHLLGIHFPEVVRNHVNI